MGQIDGNRQDGLTSRPLPSDRAVLQKAFEEFYRAFRPTVVHAVRRSFVNSSGILSDDDVEEIAQDAFDDLWTRWQQGSPPDDPRGWTLVAARNYAFKLCVDRKRQAAVPHVTDGEDPGSSSRHAQIADSRQRRALSAMVGRDVLTAAKEALGRLPETDRKIVEMAEIDKKELATIAAELGLAKEVVKKRLQRARDRMSDHLAAEAGSTFLIQADAGTYKPRSRRAASEALEALPAESAKVLRERYMEEKSLRAIADARGITFQGAQELLLRAEEHLRRRFGLTLEEFLRAVRTP